jgi:hypothetical protein
MKTIYRISMMDAQNRMQNQTVLVSAPKGLSDAITAVQKALGVQNEPSTTQKLMTVDLEVA